MIIEKSSTWANITLWILKLKNPDIRLKDKIKQKTLILLFDELLTPS